MNILFQDFLYDMSGGNSPPYLHADGLPHGRGHGIADLPVLVHDSPGEPERVWEALGACLAWVLAA